MKTYTALLTALAACALLLGAPRRAPADTAAPAPPPAIDDAPGVIPDAAPGRPVTAADVLGWIRQLPAECGLYAPTPKCPKGAPGHYERGADARAIAEAIAATARTLDEARDLTVYAAYESAFDRHARGDGGHSLGPWQLQRLPAAVAEDPLQAAPIWLARAEASRALCAALPWHERLAKLASGNCGAGRLKVRKRAIVAEALPAPTAVASSQ